MCNQHHKYHKYNRRHRYSQDERPKEGERCYFYPVKLLSQNPLIVQPIEEPMIKEYMQIGQLCTVINNKPRIVEIQFDGQDETDYVSPEFLVKVSKEKSRN